MVDDELKEIGLLTFLNETISLEIQTSGMQKQREKDVNILGTCRKIVYEYHFQYKSVDAKVAI